MKFEIVKKLLVALLGTALLAGCSSAPKAPGWPDGEARPINGSSVVDQAATQGGAR